MNYELKNLIISSGLKDEKQKLQSYRDEIFNNERRMSELTFDRRVGLYAYSFEKYLCLMMNEESDEKEINKLLDTMNSLEEIEGVQEYLRLRGKNDLLKIKIDNYFRDVNIGFRRKLSDLELPSIYVYGKDKFIHIIESEKELSIPKSNDTLVYPYYNLTSLRDLRHFYNKLSFHYLDSMIDDYSFDIKSKKLGKIKVV